jgi:cytochrome c biogenesis protein CcmG/thiol:disulfide interchange protein DsbE
MKRWQFILPLALFAVLVMFLMRGLNLNPREVPSPLIGKPAPSFALPRLDDPARMLGREDLLGKVWILNVWASWCVACREEHPLLVEFAKRKVVPIYGLNYKDGRDDAQRWLARFGDPYTASISDTQGKVGIDFGVYGVPETFVIDKQGVVRFKHIGPVTPDVLREKIEPLVKQLNA